MNQGLPPAGWYPNTTGPGMRWWDGQRWSANVHVPPVARPRPDLSHLTPAQRRARGKRRIAAVLGIGLVAAIAGGWLLFGVEWTHTDEYDEGYAIGQKTVLLGGQSPKDACELALIAKIGMGSEYGYGWRAREIKRGCIQGAIDNARDHPLPKVLRGDG
jgi:hypothetical protein